INFDLNDPNGLSNIDKAFKLFFEQGYRFNLFSGLGNTTIYCILTKTTRSKADIKIEGEGETVYEAISSALNNFPVNPLDGSQWVNNRLEAPKDEVEDAEYTEITPEASSEDVIF